MYALMMCGLSIRNIVPVGAMNVSSACKSSMMSCLEIGSYILCRHGQASDVNVKVKGFGMSTGTSVKRQHLVDCHIDLWISSCDKRKIPIAAKAVQDAVRNYRTRQGQAYSQPSSTDSTTRSPFSQEAFVSAIMNFIIADDQACISSILIKYH
jgi:hypothetical protein